MLTLNNPLVLLSLKFLGLGIELEIVRENDKTKLCFEIEALMWSYCKVWGE